MKRLLTITLVFLSLIATPAIVHADNSNPPPSSRPFLGRFRRVATSEGQRKTNMIALRKEIVTNFFDIMSKRFQDAEDRLNKIVDRIDSRIAKIKSSNPNLDLTNVESELASAKSNLSDTQTKINTLKTDFDIAMTSDTPKEQFKIVMTDISALKKELQNDRTQLLKIVSDIKNEK